MAGYISLIWISLASFQMLLVVAGWDMIGILKQIGMPGFHLYISIQVAVVAAAVVGAHSVSLGYVYTF